MDQDKAVHKIVKIFDTVIKDVDTKTNMITAVVSTNKVDRHGDIVTPESFRKRMKLYKEHPVLLSSHNYGKLTNQIGEAVKTTITDQGLEMQFKYYSGEGNPEADWAWVLAQKKIAAFSIGFMGHEFEWIKEKDKETGNEYITGRKFTDVELLEVSQVLIPANRQALQERNDFMAEEGKLTELAVKAIENGEIQEQAPVAKKEEKEPVKQSSEDVEAKDKPGADSAKDNERSHYSEVVLEDGPDKVQSRSDKVDLENAVKDAVSAAFQ